MTHGATLFAKQAMTYNPYLSFSVLFQRLAAKLECPLQKRTTDVRQSGFKAPDIRLSPFRFSENTSATRRQRIGLPQQRLETSTSYGGILRDV